MDKESISNVLDSIDDIINFATKHPVKTIYEESAANTTKPELKKMDENIIVLEW